MSAIKAGRNYIRSVSTLFLLLICSSGGFAQDDSACRSCHEDQASVLGQSAHHELKCVECHVGFDPDNIPHRPDMGSDSVSKKLAWANLCMDCHLNNPGVRAKMGVTGGFLSSYDESVHGKALKSGNTRAPSCVDCHGGHLANKGGDARSAVNREHVVETCSRCHGEIAKDFAQSVHGVAVSRGNPDAPVCINCHGEHGILKHTDPASPVAPQNVSAQVCAPCHASVRLSEKYGFVGNRVQTFATSFHGLAIRAGNIEVANCASCHGVHNIKAPGDPASMVHPANLAATCGKCHPGANERFTVGKIHVDVSEKKEPALYWIARMYIALIIAVVGAMALHNLLDFFKRARHRRTVHENTPVMRMTVNERLQHGILAVSFIFLVITGFMLRYPDAGWVAALRGISRETFEWRGRLHRIAALLLIASALYHIGYCACTRRGRKLFLDVLPKKRDGADAMGLLKFNLGLSAAPPRFGRFNYVEKSEYWALVWGTLVMTVTGAILWFDNTFMNLITKLGWDIARTIHFYEAWLAALSILVWHFYFVIFNPDVYPMDMSWLTGKTSETEREEKHSDDSDCIDS